MLQRIFLTHNIPSNILFMSGEHMQEVLQRYRKAVRTALLQAPSLVTEANVQDWLERLDALVRCDRLSELKGYQRAKSFCARYSSPSRRCSRTSIGTPRGRRLRGGVIAAQLQLGLRQEIGEVIGIGACS